MSKISGKSTEIIHLGNEETPEDKLQLFAKILASFLTKSMGWDFSAFIPGNRNKRKKTYQEKTVDLVKELLENKIDPKLFDVLLSNEMNRRLKINFGATFLLLTSFFTIASYAIVVFDGIYHWEISEIAITALIIETPIQFVGLLYIIARNLFPGKENTT